MQTEAMVTPGHKREPRRYESPPWEHAGSGEPKRRDAEEPPVPETPELESEQPESKSATEGPGEARMDAMIIELSVEERVDSTGSTFVLGMSVAVFVAFLGVVLSGYAVVAFARTYAAGPLALAGSVVVGTVGFMLLGSAVWLGVRTYDKRGV